MTSKVHPPVTGEIWFKWQRVIRTAFTTLLTILPLIPQVIAIVQDQWSVPWLAAIAAQAIAINAAITRIIAIPVVDAWLKRVGLGSSPASAKTIGKLPPGVHASYVAIDAQGRLVRTGDVVHHTDVEARTREQIDPDELTP